MNICMALDSLDRLSLILSHLKVEKHFGHDPYFIDNKTEAQKLCELSKVTWLEQSKACKPAFRSNALSIVPE